MAAGERPTRTGGRLRGKDGVTESALVSGPDGSVFVVFRPWHAAGPKPPRVGRQERRQVLGPAAAPIQVNLAIWPKVSASSTDRGHGYPPYSELKVNDGIVARW